MLTSAALESKSTLLKMSSGGVMPKFTVKLTEFEVVGVSERFG